MLFCGKFTDFSLFDEFIQITEEMHQKRTNMFPPNLVKMAKFKL